MAKAGVFDDLDAAIDWHPSDKNSVKNNPGLAMKNFTVEFWYYARDVNRESVDRLYERILKIAKGAAIATETTHKVTLLTGVHEYLLLRSLQERLQEQLEAVGPPKFNDEEQEFGRTLQRSMGIAEGGFDATITPLDPAPKAPFGGSTDVAEVSWITPTVGFRMATTAKDVPWHSWAVTACQGSDAGIRGAVAAAELIAVTGIDLLTNAELLAKAKAEFAEKTEGQPYVSPVPDDQTVPLPGTE